MQSESHILGDIRETEQLRYGRIPRIGICSAFYLFQVNRDGSTINELYTVGVNMDAGPERACVHLRPRMPKNHRYRQYALHAIWQGLFVPMNFTFLPVLPFLFEVPGQDFRSLLPVTSDSRLRYGHRNR